MKLNITMPKHPGPIFIIGAGSIVTDAHLPAYRIAGFKVAGIFDIDHAKALAVAARFSIPTVFESLEDMLNEVTEDVIFDLAVPGSAIINILRQLPEKAGILMQKPMGNDLEDAKEILRITRIRKQTAGVNFQLRYAPFITVARNLIQQGKIGDLCDIEVNVDVYTPWHIWKFMNSLPRVEILYHSIHYIDLIRTFLGNPIGVYAKSTRHPEMKDLSSVRSDIILNYGEWMGVNIHTRHCNIFGSQHQEAFIKLEGTKGAIKMRMGVLMDYPIGRSDLFEYISIDKNTAPKWETLEIEGSWFPHAFIGSMAQIMLAMDGSITRPDNSVEDCIETMACVESAYQSDREGGVKLMSW